MIRYTALPSLCCLLFCQTSFAQRVALGAKGGLLLSSSKAIHISTSPVPGAVLGLYVPYHAGPRLELQPELLLALLGSGYQEPDGDRYTTRSLYAQVPLSVKFFVNNELNLQLGGQAGKLLSAHTVTAEGNVDATAHYNPMDFGLNAGAGLDLRSGWDLTVRYYSGMARILRDEDLLFARNRTLQFTAGYRITHFGSINTMRRRRH